MDQTDCESASESTPLVRRGGLERWALPNPSDAEQAKQLRGLTITVAVFLLLFIGLTAIILAAYHYSPRMIEGTYT
jgi:hypothetical protein